MNKFIAIIAMGLILGLNANAAPVKPAPKGPNNAPAMHMKDFNKAKPKPMPKPKPKINKARPGKGFKAPKPPKKMCPKPNPKLNPKPKPAPKKDLRRR